MQKTIAGANQMRSFTATVLPFIAAVTFSGLMFTATLA